ncbi:MAG TPA: transporter, partial [Bacteroidia bacterium]|nr:transporter [Bacteroidia bacterium]
PDILITLKDENQFLALNDPADFNVYLKTPSQSVAQLIPFSSGTLLFTPANLPNNSCRIMFTPACGEDGVYQLIVQAKDRSNNASGLIDYKIEFEVVNHPSVTNVLNYPNPFSTSTHFVFTLTGNEVPDVFTIQIMTITGKVVREVNKDELGDLHIGRNITEYAWDGKDQYGDQLANGVYLYRVITRLNGDGIDHRDSGADPYIDHGWGKMYLMR